MCVRACLLNSVSLQASGDYERAAAWALFHGKVTRAVAALSSSKGKNESVHLKLDTKSEQLDEKHRLISTVLAGYHRDSAATNTWRELCKSLSVDLKGPYLRAIFAYIASGEWSSVLSIADLPFRDRLGVALRFLNDEEVSVRSGIVPWFINSLDSCWCISRIMLLGPQPVVILKA